MTLFVTFGVTAARLTRRGTRRARYLTMACFLAVVLAGCVTAAACLRTDGMMHFDNLTLRSFFAKVTLAPTQMATNLRIIAVGLASKTFGANIYMTRDIDDMVATRNGSIHHCLAGDV